MTRAELIFFAVLLLIAATGIAVTTHSPWGWPVSFTGGYLLSEAVWGRRRVRR